MLNIVSLPKYIDEIRILLAKQDLDILALNETRLDDMLSDDLMSVHNYDLIRTDRNRQGGGVCLYIRSNLNYLNRNDSIPAILEAVCVEIHKPNSQPFIVASIYRSPSASSQYFSMIESFIDKLDSEGKEIIMVGDLNCNMLDSLNSASKKLNDFLNVYQLSQLIVKPTRVTQTTSSLLDVCISSLPEKIIYSDVFPIGISDHNLIFVMNFICCCYVLRCRICSVLLL